MTEDPFITYYPHPSVLGKYSFKLRGVWVRHLPTGHIGYISYVEHPQPDQILTEHPPRLWIIYPAKPVNPINSISFGSATPEEVKKLRKRTPKRFAHPTLFV